MTRYLLDTDTLIDFSKRIEPVAGRVFALMRTDHEVGISPIQLTEFFTAVSPNERRRWTAFFGTLYLWPIGREVAIRAGIDRYDFARRGQQLSTDDCLTASVARARQATLVTNNLRHFPMPDLQLLSLRTTSVT